MSRIISVGTLKGGVAKTMTVFNLAGYLAYNNFKVLCIDMDPQGNLTTDLGVDRSDRNLIGLEKVFCENSQVTFGDVIVKSPIKELPTLDLLASTVLLHKSELYMAYATARESVLKNFIADNQSDFLQYDYIIIDTNPSLSYLNQNAFVVSDKIIMPTTADTSDLDGMHLFCALWDDFRSKLRIKDNISAVLITKNDKRNSIERDFIDYVKNSEDNKDIAEILLDTVIPANVRLKESKMSHKPVCIYDENCKGAKAYKSLVDELFKKGVL